MKIIWFFRKKEGSRHMSEKKDNYHHGDLRKALLDNTVKMIISEGIAKISLREIARKTGVSRTAPYRHFKDKNELMCAVAEDGFKQLKEIYVKVLANEINPLNRLKKIGFHYVKFATENPGYFKLMFGNEVIKQDRPETLLEAAFVAFEEVLKTIELGKEKKLFPEESTENLANVAWSMVHGLATLILDGQIQISDSKHPTPTLIAQSQPKQTHKIDEFIDYAMDKIINGLTI